MRILNIERAWVRRAGSFSFLPCSAWVATVPMIDPVVLHGVRKRMHQ